MARNANAQKARNKAGAKKSVETLTHDEATRKNIPTAEFQSVMAKEHQSPIRVAYERRNRDLDPQLVWRGKDEQDWSDLVVQAPPLFIQEKVHPKVLIDDLLRRTKTEEKAAESQMDLFADFNGLPNNDAKTDFYQHDANWSNRMILGDSLQVMASLAEREGLRGQVQCIYIDPPYGIKFNSNFQWSTTSRDVKDGSVEQITREPEQVKAFRDTWRDGIHSYLTYLRDRLSVARDLLAESGSIFVQIGDENVHRVREVMDEVFGETNFVSLIAFTKGATGLGSTDRLPARLDYIVWYSRRPEAHKFRQLYTVRTLGLDPNFNWVQYPDGQFRRMTPEEKSGEQPLPAGVRLFGDVSLTKPGPGRKFEIKFKGQTFDSGKRWWGMTPESLERVLKTGRADQFGSAIRQLRFQDESTAVAIGNLWEGFLGQSDPVYVVQTNVEIVRRCLLLTTDPGDLVLDPTCGSGTTAYVAEQWGRRWITIDTSRVALALARARIMGARYQYYLLADSKDGQLKEAEVTRCEPSTTSTRNSIRQGFVYERVPHVTLKSIANNAEIDVIWEELQAALEPLREQLNAALAKKWQEWEVPREPEAKWSDKVKKLHAAWWEQRILRQKRIDAAVASKAEFECLYDKPYDDKKKVRVAGPFTVESLSPHRMLGVGADDELLDPAHPPTPAEDETDFARMILENLKTAGVQQAHKEDKIAFTSITPWPGRYVCAEGRYIEGDSETGTEKRAGIFIGPEFGTVARQDLVAAAREAGDADFDVLIACAFNYEAHASEFTKLGRIPVLKARMNADLHMADTLKNTGKGNLFVIFGEPDIGVYEGRSAALAQEVNRRTDRLKNLAAEAGELKRALEKRTKPAGAGEDTVERNWIKTRLAEIAAETKKCEAFVAYAATVPVGQVFVQIFGVDVFHPSSGEVRSDGAEGIACWFIDTDYNEESFFVRHAYFLGANDPYKSLKTTLKAEINEDAWATLNRDTSRPFAKPNSGRIAVKVINHLGDEVMKVFRVE